MNLIPVLLASASNPTTAEIYGGMFVAILLLSAVAVFLYNKNL